MKNYKKLAKLYGWNDTRTPIRVELWHDGKFVESCASYNEAFGRLLKLQGQSTLYALMWGGWKQKPIYEEAKKD